jgi:hypothetical protein
MQKMNSSSVKSCESSRRPRLAQKFSIVTRAVVTPITGRGDFFHYFLPRPESNPPREA